jgi:predicted transcriptional regulator
MPRSGRLAQGELETLVMDALWRSDGFVSPAAVHEMVAERGHDVAYTTVATVLTRLSAKELVERRAARRGFEYRSLVDQETLAAQRMQALLETTGDPRAALTHFVDGMDRRERDALRAALDRRVRRNKR